MASPSKEQQILRLLLENSPLKEWHFDEIVLAAKVTRAVANKWLKKFVADGVLHHVKAVGSSPFYTVGQRNAVYYSLKRLYVLEQLHQSGLIPQLLSLEGAQTVILFGSMIKGDWYKDSDIDIFVFGNVSGFDTKTYQLRLRRNIELHVFENKAEIRKIRSGLMNNVVNGYVVKGRIQDVVEVT